MASIIRVSLETHLLTKKPKGSEYKIAVTVVKNPVYRTLQEETLKKHTHFFLAEFAIIILVIVLFEFLSFFCHPFRFISLSVIGILIVTQEFMQTDKPIFVEINILE